MSVSEIMESTGLNEESAGLALERSYSEPFLIYGDESGVETVREKDYVKKGITTLGEAGSTIFSGKTTKGKR